MASEPYKPAGYCPHCGYAIDPGTCSECGKTSSADQLDRVPYWITRKRIIKRTITTIAILGILIGGWYSYTHVKWESRLSTSTLLRLQGYRLNQLNGELYRRFRARTLSPAEQQQMFANDLAETNLLQIRDRYPAGVTVVVERPKMPLPLFSMRAYCQQLTVDGQPVDPAMKHLGSWWLSPDGWAIGPLAPGQHRVTQVLAIAREWGYHTLDPPQGTVPFATFTTSRTLVIENRPVTEYAKPVWSPELAQSFKQKATAHICHYHEPGGHYVQILVLLESPPVPVAGRLWCDFGDGRMPVLGGVTWPGSEGVLGSRRLVDYRMAFSLPFPKDAPSPWLVDMYLVPDPEVAFNNDLTDYFGGVIVWSKCRVEEPIESTEVDSTGQVKRPFNAASAVNRLGEMQLPATRPWRDLESMRKRAAKVGLPE